MEWMILPLKRYAQFSGRSRRREFWMWVLFNWTVAIGLAVIDTLIGFGGTSAVTGPMGAAYSWYSNGPLSLIWMLATFIPNLSVSIRRLHDIDKSGWWLLILLVPLVGFIALVVFQCVEGTRGANRFGPDPIRQRPDLDE
jgi:uncharacterized membrane protein YhaH (DUF805 family)